MGPGVTALFVLLNDSIARICVSDGDDAQTERSLSSGLLVSVPGAPHREFGSGFSREFEGPACRELSSRVEREPDGGDGTGGAGAAETIAGSVRHGIAASPKRRKNNKNGARNNKKSGVKTTVPTLLKIHQRVIKNALLELTRSREEVFENLGQRLGGEPEDFTFYDGTFNFAAGLPARLPACAAQRRKFSRTRRKVHQRMRGGQPNIHAIKAARFHRAQTDHVYGGSTLPRFKKDHESWKIPLLRVATPTNNGEHHGFTSATPFVNSNGARVGSHSRLSGAAAAGQAQPQNYPGRHSASCPPRKLRKDASVDRKHPRTVEGSGKRGRHGGGNRSDVDNIASLTGAKKIPADEIVESIQQRSLQVSAGDELSRQGGQHGTSYGTTEAEAAAAPPIEDVGPIDITQLGPRAVEMSGSPARVRAEECVDEIVSQGMQTHLAASSPGRASATAARTLPTSAEADDARLGAVDIMSPEANAATETCVDETLSQHLRTQDSAIGATGPRPEGRAYAEPERFAIQGGAAAASAVQHGTTEEGHCVDKEVSQANKSRQVAAPGNEIPRSWSAAANAEGAEAKRFVEEVVSDVIRAHMHAAFRKEIGRSLPATEMERDCASSNITTSGVGVQPGVLEQVVADAVRQSSHAAVAAVLDEQSSELTTDAGLNDPSARLVANSVETLALSPTSAISEDVSPKPLHEKNLSKDDRQDDPNEHLGVETKGLPVGFLDEIVAGQASLKPTASTPRSTSSKPSQSELRMQKEIMEAELKQRAAVLRELEELVRTERLDRYAPESFSRGAVHGEGRYSVVYCAAPIRSTEERQRGGWGGAEVHPAGDADTPESNTLAAGLVLSVMAASISSVTARESRRNSTGSTGFAAKEFRYTRQDAPLSVLRDALREVCAHLRVAGCAHVVALRGVWLTPRVTLLLEPMGIGNLHNFIRRDSEETCHGEEEGCGDGLAPAGKAWLLAGVADGLAALHDAGVVHRDVKSHNVMMVRRQRPPIDDDLVGGSGKLEKGIKKCTSGKSEWEAKLGDLGSAALVPPEGRAALTEEAGTSGWVAPEVFGDEGYGTAADIFSLGVLIWEAFTRGALENPLSGLSGQTYRAKLRESLRPPWPPQVEADVKGLVERCWAFEPGERPRAGVVADELRAFATAAAADGSAAA
eukprot:jgi/Undpi1/13799/HiC_scaffold_9.g03450.m1